MKKLSTLFSILATLIMISCNTESPKTLVLYYSQSGTTKTVAEALAKSLKADIEAVEAETPYDGDFGSTIARCQEEIAAGTVPAVKPLKADLAKYDVVFLGYPVWFGTYARPIMGLIEAVDLNGKKIVPFCTFGSGGLEATAADLKAALPGASVASGYGVRTARIDAMPAELSRFLIENSYIDGKIDPLPAFSAQQPVTEAEKAIFDAACGDYQFPLGTPVSVGSRAIPGATEYEYTVDSFGQDGRKATSVIYVVAAPGSKPEFTRVVR